MTNNLTKMLPLFSPDIDASVKNALFMQNFMKSESAKLMSSFMLNTALNDQGKKTKKLGEEIDTTKKALNEMVVKTVGSSLTPAQQTTLSAQGPKTFAATEYALGQYTALPAAQQTAAAFNNLFVAGLSASFAGDSNLTQIVTDLKASVSS